MRKSGSFYIVNNGDNAFRVNDVLLNPNEASPLGTRAVINVMSLFCFEMNMFLIPIILF